MSSNFVHDEIRKHDVVIHKGKARSILLKESISDDDIFLNLVKNCFGKHEGVLKNIEGHVIESDNTNKQ